MTKSSRFVRSAIPSAPHRRFVPPRGNRRLDQAGDYGNVPRQSRGEGVPRYRYPWTTTKRRRPLRALVPEERNLFRLLLRSVRHPRNHRRVLSRRLHPHRQARCTRPRRRQLPRCPSMAHRLLQPLLRKNLGSPSLRRTRSTQAGTQKGPNTTQPGALSSKPPPEWLRLRKNLGPLRP